MTTIASNTLDTRIDQALTGVAQAEVLRLCWYPNLTQADYEQKAGSYVAYFNHWHRVCRKEISGNDFRHLNHQHLLSAFGHIKKEPWTGCIAKLEELYNGFGTTFPRHVRPMHEFLQKWIILTGKVILLLDLKDWALDNNESKTLLEFLSQEVFTQSQLTDKYRVLRSFSLRNLNAIGGLRIRWTDLMSEHLTLEKDNSQVAVFHHVDILDMLSESKIYPPGLIAELDTLHNLLLPRFDKKAATWFKDQLEHPKSRANGSSSIIDPAFGQTQHLVPFKRHIDEFPYYKDRLIALKEEYDHHEPSTLWQHIIDNRRPSRQWGFVIAVIVFVFGAIQAATGIVQCYKAYNPSK